MPSVSDAEPLDVYVDKQGKLWRVVGVCKEPTVIMEEVEGTLFDPNARYPLTAAQGCVVLPNLASGAASITRARKSGGVGGYMWDGFKRIFRPETTAP